MLQLVEFAFMLVIDLAFFVALILLMLPLGMWRQAAFAVMKRNFVGYFSNPTGYVFLCLFVLLTSFAAFWPHEFFTTNLANFDQLNKFLPYIMLIFIPAITMSIWAEERRQGTDELLLTLPAKDIDIVIGKYFAAVLVFTVSLLFSQLSNYAVLLAMTGGSLDNFLLFSTYLGYWFMGIAMISLGMVASFLTSNLTVGFIFGAAFNAPLAFFSNSDLIISNGKWINRLFDWSLLQRFEPFGRGLISASSIFYFLGIVVVGIYLSLILIGRRHWLGGRDGTSLFWHYMARAAFLIVLAISAVLIVQHSPLNRARMDISEGKVSTLADSTTKVLNDLASEPDKPPIKIEAYVSNSVPSEFVKTKYDLVNLLREFDVLGGKRIQVDLHQGIEPFSEEAILAEKKYGIRPTNFSSQSRGAMREEEIILGVAFSCGRERIVIPSMPYGMPIEYELMRSINTVATSQRKTIGIVQTDALVMGANVSTEGQTLRIPRLRIISELQKQFNVELVDAATEIPLWLDAEEGGSLQRRYDALLVVQPSKMAPVELSNLIAAIQSGQPTAIFEDPLLNPANFTVTVGQQQRFQYLRGTLFPRTFNRLSPETANIQDLWDALDLDVDFGKTRVADGSTARFSYVVWQSEDRNPYPRDQQLNQKEQVVIKERNPESDPRFSRTHSATQGIDELYFQFVGNIQGVAKTKLNHEALVTTSNAGRVLVSDVMSLPRGNQLDSRRGSTNQQFALAAAIQGSNPNPDPPKTPGAIKRGKEKTNVIYVSDVDILSDFFVQTRNYPIRQGNEYRFQNMSFVLNIIDSLAGEETYLGLRNRRVNHITLEVVEKTTKKAMDTVYDMTQQFQIEYDSARSQIINDVKALSQDTERNIERESKKKAEGKPYDAVKLAALQALLASQRQGQAEKFQAQVAELENERREKKRSIDLTAELEIQEIQRKFKLAAVLIPPIPPLLVGLVVFTRRRLREREGIAKARRLK